MPLDSTGGGRRTGWLAGWRARPTIAVASPASTPEQPAAAAPPTGPTAPDLAAVCAQLEGDLDAVVSGVAQGSAAARRAGDAAQTDAAESRRLAQDAQEAADGARDAVASVAAATEQLAAAGREIAGQAALTDGMTAGVLAAAERAGAAVAALERAVAEIDSVTAAIARVAEQTNLLALNATIEAARAGAAGKGFAVVASEVKALAGQTRAATDQVAQRTAELRTATRGTATAIEEILGGARGIGDASGSVATAVTEQDAALRGIARSTQDAAAGAARSAELVRSVAAQTDRVGRVAGEVASAAAQADGGIAELRATLSVALRRIGSAEVPPVPVLIRARLSASGGPEATGAVLEASPAAAMLRLDAPAPAWMRADASATLHLEGVGALSATVATLGGTAVHLLLRAEGGARAGLDARLEREAARDARFVARAQQVAAQIETAFAAALDGRELTLADLFDTDYRPVPGSDPAQVTTRFLPLTDRLLPALQEPVLGFDPAVVFCAAVDRNGYLPTHNRVWSQPQRPNEPAWNASHCRNRRIFDDRAGLTAARSTRPFLVQSYERVMGGGERVAMKEADAPIAVRGRHWGALRLAFRAGN